MVSSTSRPTRHRCRPRLHELESWKGTVTVIGGTGVFAKASGKKGVLKCTSGDSVHLNCTEKLTLKQL